MSCSQGGFIRSERGTLRLYQAWNVSRVPHLDPFASRRPYGLGSTCKHPDAQPILCPTLRLEPAAPCFQSLCVPSRSVVLICVLQDSPHKWRVDKWANDLSCAVFSLANVVTIMYYIVDTSTHVRMSAQLLSLLSVYFVVGLYYPAVLMMLQLSNALQYALCI